MNATRLFVSDRVFHGPRRSAEIESRAERLVADAAMRGAHEAERIQAWQRERHDADVAREFRIAPEQSARLADLWAETAEDVHRSLRMWVWTSIGVVAFYGALGAYVWGWI